MRIGCSILGLKINSLFYSTQAKKAGCRKGACDLHEYKEQIFVVGTHNSKSCISSDFTDSSPARRDNSAG